MILNIDCTSLVFDFIDIVPHYFVMRKVCFDWLQLIDQTLGIYHWGVDGVRLTHLDLDSIRLFSKHRSTVLCVYPVLDSVATYFRSDWHHSRTTLLLMHAPNIETLTVHSDDFDNIQPYLLRCAKLRSLRVVHRYSFLARHRYTEQIQHYPHVKLTLISLTPFTQEDGITLWLQDAHVQSWFSETNVEKLVAFAPLSLLVELIGVSGSFRGERWAVLGSLLARRLGITRHCLELPSHECRLSLVRALFDNEKTEQRRQACTDYFLPSILNHMTNIIFAYALEHKVLDREGYDCAMNVAFTEVANLFKGGYATDLSPLYLDIVCKSTCRNRKFYLMEALWRHGVLLPTGRETNRASEEQRELLSEFANRKRTEQKHGTNHVPVITAADFHSKPRRFRIRGYNSK